MPSLLRRAATPSRSGRATVAAGLVCVVVATLLMWPVLPAPHHRVFGYPSDPLAEVWRLEQFRDGTVGLIGDTVAETANAPDGLTVRRPVEVMQVAYDLPAFALVRILPAVAAYNLLVWAALWTAGWAAAWGLLRLGVRFEGAVTAGTLLMLAPANLLEAQLHVALAIVAPLALLLSLGVSVIRRPRVGAGALLGAGFGACAYVNPYLPLQAAALAVGLAVAAAAAAAVHPARRGPLTRAALAAVGAATATTLPILAVLATHRGAIDTAVGRPETDLARFTLEPAALFDRGASTYVGVAVLALAAAGLVWGRGGGALRGALGATAVAGVWMALSPATPVIGALAPAELIHGVLPYWRVYGRAETVAMLGLVGLAALAVARVAEHRAAAARVAAAALAALAVGDLVRRPPAAAADLGRPDPIAGWLAGARGSVAELPLIGVDDYRLGVLLFRQTRHGRPLLNGGAPGTRSADIAAAVNGDGGAQGLAALRVAGVDRVAVAEGAAVPGGLVAAGVPGARAFVVPRGDAAVAVALSGFPEEPGAGGRSFRWMSPGASLRVLASCPGTVRLGFTAVSHSVPRRVRIGGATVAVDTIPTPVTLPLRVGDGLRADLPITSDPPAAPLPGGDPRVADVGVSLLSASVRCAAGG